MVRDIWIAFLVLTTGTVTMAAAQASNRVSEETSGWTYPVIKDYGPAWRLPHAAVQPQRERTYKVIFDLTKAPNPNEILDGLGHAARLLNVFAAD